MIHHSNCSYKLETMTLARWGDSPFKTKRDFFIDEVEVAWLTESETRYDWYVNGLLLHESANFSDYYGLGTSLENCIKEAERAAAAYQIELGKPSVVAIRCHSKVVRIPLTLVETNDGFGRPGFQRIEGTYYGDLDTLHRIRAFDWNGPYKEGDWTPSEHRLQEVVLFEDVTWSSDDTNASHRPASERFKQLIGEALKPA